MKVLFILVFLVSIGSFGFAQQELLLQQAVIQEVSGKVEIKTPVSDWVLATAGQALDNDTIISTGFKSMLRIGIGNSVLTVRPLTRLSLQEIWEEQGDGAGRSEKVTLNLQTGRVRADVKPPSGGKTDFTVRSSSAVASVRGTNFEFDGIALKVEAGRVHLSGKDGTGVNVSAGHKVETNPATGKTPRTIETVTESMQPAAPAGTENIPVSPPPAAPVMADVEVGVVWQ